MSFSISCDDPQQLLVAFSHLLANAFKLLQEAITDAF